MYDPINTEAASFLEVAAGTSPRHLATQRTDPGSSLHNGQAPAGGKGGAAGAAQTPADGPDPLASYSWSGEEPLASSEPEQYPSDEFGDGATPPLRRPHHRACPADEALDRLDAIVSGYTELASGEDATEPARCRQLLADLTGDLTDALRDARETYALEQGKTNAALHQLQATVRDLAALAAAAQGAAKRTAEELSSVHADALRELETTRADCAEARAAAARDRDKALLLRDDFASLLQMATRAHPDLLTALRDSGQIARAEAEAVGTFLMAGGPLDQFAIGDLVATVADARAALAGEHECLRRRLAELEQGRNAVRERCQALALEEGRLERDRKKVERYRGAIVELEHEKEQSEQTLRTLEVQVKDIRARKQQLGRDVANEDREYRRRLDDLNKGGDPAIQELQKLELGLGQLELLRQQADGVGQALLELDEKKAEAEATNALLESRVEEIRDRNQELELEVAAEEEKCQRLLEKQRKTKELMRTYARAEEEGIGTAEDLAELQRLTQAIATALEAERQKLIQGKCQLETLQTQKAEMDATLEKKWQKARELQTAVGELAENIEALAGRVADLKVDRDKLAATAASAEGTLEAVKRKVAVVRRRQWGTLRDLEVTARQTDRSVAEHQAALAAAEKLLEQANQDLKRQSGLVEEVKLLTQEAQEEYAEAEAARAGRAHDLDRLTQQIAAENEECRKTRRTLKEVQAKRRKLREDLAIAQGELIRADWLRQDQHHSRARDLGTDFSARPGLSDPQAPSDRLPLTGPRRSAAPGRGGPRRHVSAHFGDEASPLHASVRRTGQSGERLTDTSRANTEKGSRKPPFRASRQPAPLEVEDRRRKAADPLTPPARRQPGAAPRSGSPSSTGLHGSSSSRDQHRAFGPNTPTGASRVLAAQPPARRFGPAAAGRAASPAQTRANMAPGELRRPGPDTPLLPSGRTPRNRIPTAQALWARNLHRD